MSEACSIPSISPLIELQRQIHSLEMLTIVGPSSSRPGQIKKQWFTRYGYGAERDTKHGTSTLVRACRGLEAHEIYRFIGRRLGQLYLEPDLSHRVCSGSTGCCIFINEWPIDSKGLTSLP